MSRLRNAILNLVLLIVSTAIGLFLVEFGVRVHAYYKYAVAAEYPVYAINIPGAQNQVDVPRNLYGPFAGGPFTLSIYDMDGKLRQRNFVSINNYGWISKNDYKLEKAADEFRIAVIGDSFTATLTNTRTWTDTLQVRLNADPDLLRAVGKRRITVLNLGEPGGGFEYFYSALSHVAFRFSPDLTIVNYITEDIRRLHARAETVRRDPRAEPAPDPQRPPVPWPMSYHLEYGDIKVPVICVLDDCNALPTWWIAQGREVPQEEMQRIKQKVGHTMAWRRVMLSRRLLLVDMLLPNASTGIVTPDYVGRSVQALKYMQQLHPRLLLAQAPTFEHLTLGQGKNLLAEFETAVAAAGFESKRIERWMPTQRNATEIKTWFNLPYDGHFSDAGADLYAIAIHHYIRSHILKEHGPGLTNDPCAPALSSYERSKSLSNTAKPEMIVGLSSAASLLPADAKQRFRSADTFADCGFAADLFRLYAEALLADGRLEAAEDAANEGLTMAPSGIELNIVKSQIDIARGRTREAFSRLSGLAAKVVDPPIRAALFLTMGDMALSAAAPREAELAYRQVLSIQPNYLPALEGISTALLALGRPQDALGQINAALGQAPDKADLLYARAQALLGLNLPGQALEELAKIPASHQKAAALRTILMKEVYNKPVRQ